MKKKSLIIKNKIPHKKSRKKIYGETIGKMMKLFSFQRQPIDNMLEMDRAARDPQHAGLAMPKLLLCHL
jgi:hypothetical protein